MINLLSKIAIVLVEPTHPGNVGAVARAMKTMGLSDLVLVNPRKFPHYEATKRAAGADSVLTNARIFADLSTAIADRQLILGTSVRDREVSWPTRTPKEMAQHALSDQQDSPKMAILFGRENSGLTNQELETCDYQIRIPANDEYSSLNLASAVQIIAYELRMQALQQSEEKGDIVGSAGAEDIEQNQAQNQAKARQRAATQLEKEGHLSHLQETLEQLDFIKSRPPTKLMRKLTRLYNKANLTQEEIQMLRGILSAVNMKFEDK